MKAIPFQPRWSKNVPRLPPGSAKQGTLDWRSNFNVQQLQRAPPIAPATSLQPRYSLVQREIETKSCYCLREGIGPSFIPRWLLVC
jgi:hypothetical protein